VRLDQGAGDLADVVRTLDSEGLKVSNLRLDEPSLDDVFLEKTGRSLEGAGDEEVGEAQA
jgi:ABC-2 type transport system ATP-binding protein